MRAALPLQRPVVVDGQTDVRAGPEVWEVSNFVQRLRRENGDVLV